MAEPVTLQTLLTYLTLISVPVGVFYYISTLRNQNKARQAQLYNSIWNQSMNNPHFQKLYMRFISLQWDNFDEFLEIFPYNDFESENTMAYWGIALFFEGITPLVKEGLLEIRFLTGTIGGLLISFWNRIEPIIDEAREHYQNKKFLEDTEYLYNELMKYLEEHPD
jgi:hypothetical protein